MRYPIDRKRKSQGFTLIELMIVIAIIGILAAIALPNLVRARFKSYHAACIQNVRTIATAMEVYGIENKHRYPPDLATLAAGNPPFLSAVPTCPTNVVSYEANYTPSADNRNYVVSCPGLHEVQLPGTVDDTYPQAVDGVVFADKAP